MLQLQTLALCIPWAGKRAKHLQKGEEHGGRLPNPHCQGTRGKSWGEGDPKGRMLSQEGPCTESRAGCAELWRSCWSTAPAQNWVSLSSRRNVHYSQPLGSLWPLCSPEGDAMGPPPAAATAILGHASKHGHFPLDTRASPEGGWGGSQRSGLRESTSSPSHSSLPVSWDIPWETQPSRSRHKEGDFSLFLAWALGTEHLTMRTSRKFRWQTSKEGK